MWFDNNRLAAGFNQLYYGRYIPTLTQQGLEGLGMSPQAAANTVAFAEIFAGGGAYYGATRPPVSFTTSRPITAGLNTSNTETNAAHNAATHQRLAQDYRAMEAAEPLVNSLRATGQLPSNYVNKTQATAQGWTPGKALNSSVPGAQIGGDVYRNAQWIVPSASGRIRYEADIGISNTMSRGNQPGIRLLYSNDGLLYITTDHYKSATPFGHGNRSQYGYKFKRHRDKK